MPYFDHHTQSPLRPGVLDVMAAAAHAGGNPSSLHQLGRRARRTLGTAHSHLQALVAAEPQMTDVIMCANLAEARSLSIVGLARAERARRGRDTVVLDASLFADCPALVQMLCYEGFKVGCAQGADGPVGIHTFALGKEPWPQSAQPIAPESVAVFAASALSALGEVMPWASWTAWLTAHDVPLVIDAAKAAGRITLQAAAWGAWATLVAGGPLGGPPAVAAIVVRKQAALTPLWYGGGQHLGRRPGTEAVVLAAGLGEAAWHAHLHGAAEQIRLGHMRAELCAGLVKKITSPMSPGSSVDVALPAGCQDLVRLPCAAPLVTARVSHLDRQGLMVGWHRGLLGYFDAAVTLCLGWNTTACDIRDARVVLTKLAASPKKDACEL